MPPQFVILKELERLRLSDIQDLLTGRTKRDTPLPICPERVSGPVEAPDGSTAVVMRCDGCDMYPCIEMHRSKDGRLMRIVGCLEKPLT